MQIAALFPNPGFYPAPRANTPSAGARPRRVTSAILVPQRAVKELQGVPIRWPCWTATNKAHIKTVQVGEQMGNDWLIDKGLEANDRVVVEGTAKVKEGTVVDPQPYRAQGNRQRPRTLTPAQSSATLSCIASSSIGPSSRWSSPSCR